MCRQQCLYHNKWQQIKNFNRIKCSFESADMHTTMPQLSIFKRSHWFFENWNKHTLTSLGLYVRHQSLWVFNNNLQPVIFNWHLTIIQNGGRHRSTKIRSIIYCCCFRFSPFFGAFPFYATIFQRIYCQLFYTLCMREAQSVYVGRKFKYNMSIKRILYDTTNSFGIIIYDILSRIILFTVFIMNDAS